MHKVLIPLLLLPFFCFSQSLSPYKNVNAIMVTRNDTSQNSIYIKLKTYLSDIGYSIQKSDENMFAISTRRNLNSKIDAQLYVTASVVGNEIWFTAEFDEAFGKSQLKYTNDMENSVALFWQEFDGVARGFGSRATYFTR